MTRRKYFTYWAVYRTVMTTSWRAISGYCSNAAILFLVIALPLTPPDDFAASDGATQ